MRTVPFVLFALWASLHLPGSGVPGALLLSAVAWITCPLVFMASLRNPWRLGPDWLAQRTLLLSWRIIKLDRIERMARSRVSSVLVTHTSVRISDDLGGWIRITDHSAWDSVFHKTLGAALKARGWDKALWFDGPDAYLLYQELSGDRRPRKRHAGAWQDEQRATPIGSAERELAKLRSVAVGGGFVDGSMIPAYAAASAPNLTDPASMTQPFEPETTHPAAPVSEALVTSGPESSFPTVSFDGPTTSSDNDEISRVTPPVFPVRAPSYVPSVPQARPS